jgi:hypothetical protein
MRKGSVPTNLYYTPVSVFGKLYGTYSLFELVTYNVD